MKKFLLLSLMVLVNSSYSEELNDTIFISNNEALELPLPLPYKKIEVSEEELKAFVVSAKEKQAVIIFGANWCPDCRILAGTLKLPSVKKFMQTNYSILHIDLGKYDINMALLEILGIPKQEGVPRVVIFDNKGKPINLDTNDRWRTARDSKQQEIFNYFQKYALN